MLIGMKSWSTRRMPADKCYTYLNLYIRLSVLYQILLYLGFGMYPPKIISTMAANDQLCD